MTTEKKLGCPYCEREFETDMGLRSHIRQTHPDEAPMATQAPAATCTVHLTGPNQSGGQQEFKPAQTVGEVLEAFEMSGDIYKENMGDPIAKAATLASLGGDNLFLHVR